MSSLRTGQSTEQSPLSITELARSLKNDPDLIYEFVKNNIAFVPIYGLQKGAVGALIDGAGTPFDQADLLVQLLRAAGYSANYVKGEIYLTPAQFQSWYGVDVSSACSTWWVPAAGRIPLFNYWSQSYCDAPMEAMRLTHLWVKVNIGGTWYAFDPSFKSHTTIPGMTSASIASAMGYNQTTFLNNARSGATVNSNYVQNLNRANIRNNLGTYANNLINNLKANKNDARLEDVIGGKKIDPVSGPVRQTTLPYQWSGSTPEEWVSIDNSYRIHLRFQYRGIDWTFLTDDVAGKRITLSFNSSNVPELRADGNLLATGSAPAANSWTSATLSTTFYAFSDTGADNTVQPNLFAAPGRVYLIANAWGPTGKGQIELHRRRLVAAKADGYADSSELVQGEVAALVAASWSAQTTRIGAIYSQMANATPLILHQIGIGGQNGSPYVDFPAVNWNSISNFNNPNQYPNFVASTIGQSSHYSAMEGQGIQEVTGTSAVSTTKLIDIAVSNGNKIYDARSGNYTSAVRANLKNYHPDVISMIDSDVSNGWRIIAPEYGNISENQYQGVGLHGEKEDSGSFYTYQFINGSLSGGVATVLGVPDGNVVAENKAPPPVPSYQANAGPIDAFRGNYRYDNEDIGLGQKDAPGSLSLVRYYNSGQGARDGALGRGWTHNLSGSAKIGADSFQGLGDDSGIDAAAAVAEIFVTNDILSNPSTTSIPLDRQVVTRVAERWLSDQLTNNVVTINTGSSGKTFVKLPDGSYNPPQGDNSRLTLSSGAYSVELSSGAKLNFNTSGNLLSTWDPSGLTTNFTYTSGRLTAVSNSAGRQLTLGYTGARITSVTDGTGRSIGYTYDSIGNLTQYRNPLNQAYNYGYDVPGRLTKLFMPTSTTTALITNTYTEDSRLKSQQDALGKIWSFFASGPRFEVNDPLGNRTSAYYDEFGNQTAFVEPRGFKTAYQYDGHNRLIRTILPEGNQVQYKYDVRHNRTEERRIAKSGSGLADLVTTAGFPATCGSNFRTCNLPSWTKDAKGNQTDFAYNSTTGQVATVTGPAASAGGTRPQTRYTYGSTNGVSLLTGTSTCRTLASCANAADEVKVTIVNNSNFLPTSVTVAAGNASLSATTALTYDAVGNRLTVDGPLAGTADTTRWRYDSARRNVGIVGPDPDGAGSRPHLAQRFTYNSNGELTQTEAGTVTAQTDSAWTAFSSHQQNVLTLDALGRTVRSVTKSGATTHAVSDTSYDNASRTECVTTRMNPSQWATVTGACSLQTAGTNGSDRITRRYYDAAGNMTQYRTAFGTAQESIERINTYTNNGLLASVRDAENNRTTYVYDGFDRLSRTRFPIVTQGANTSSTTDYEQLSYDANGNVTQKRLRDGKLITFALDNLDRVMTKTLPSPELAVNYTYDLLGRQLTVTRPGASLTHSFTYDALGRRTSEAQPYGTISWQYDLAGRRTRTTWNDGVYVTFDYDVAGRMTAIRENGAASGVGVLATYGYDNLGRRTSLTRGNGTTTSYAFDAVSRMTSLTQDLAGTANDITIGSMTYNPASQILSQQRSNDGYAWNGHYNVNRNYTVNGLNQMTASGSVALGYDGRGNLTSSGTTSYTYTAENRLSTATGGISATYDPLGRLLQYTSSATTRFVHDNGQMATEVSTAGAILRRYVWGANQDEAILWYEGSGVTDRRWLHADERGSIIAITDGTGAMTAINRYDEYGIPGSANVGRFQYTGQAWMSGLGMYYYKARMYSPTLGRFLQTDPAGYRDGMNWYNYVSSDPLNFIDPLGLGAMGSQYLGLTGGCTLCNATSGYDPSANNIIITANRPSASSWGYNPWLPAYSIPLRRPTIVYAPSFNPTPRTQSPSAVNKAVAEKDTSKPCSGWMKDVADGLYKGGGQALDASGGFALVGLGAAATPVTAPAVPFLEGAALISGAVGLGARGLAGGYYWYNGGNTAQIGKVAVGGAISVANSRLKPLGKDGSVVWDALTDVKDAPESPSNCGPSN
jgi:RHS repeat-associated protein